MSNDEAIKIEGEIIKTFGRINENNGILTNMTDGGEGINNFSIKDKKFLRKKVYQYDLNGEFIKEWESINSVKIGTKYSSNISTQIKRNKS